MESRVGGGGTAVVYRALDTYLGRPVAIKVLRPEYAADEALVRRFRREANAAAGLGHPNVVAVYDVGMDGRDTHYIVMEYVDGETLKEVIKRAGRLDVPSATRVARALLDALECAHAAGVVHCDVKPQNILLTRDGRVKVTDFGLARATTSATLVVTGTMVGTAHYVSPEQANGLVPDERTDIYSAGVTLYEMLTGRVPFDGDAPLAVALSHVYHPAPPLREFAPEVPAAVEHVVERAMAKSPDDRYPNVAAFRSDLENALAGRPLLPVPEKRGVPHPKRRSRRRWIGAAVTVAILGAGSYAAYAAAMRWLYVPTVTVPNVVGLSVTAAEQNLGTDHLLASVVAQRYSSQPINAVLAASPAPGTQVREGRTVSLTVSEGPHYVAGGVPDVSGVNQRDAGLKLQNAGLLVGGTRKRYDAAVPAGEVISTNPPVGAMVAMGDKVSLVVSEGAKPVPVKMPNLVGQGLSAAESVLRSIGLVVGNLAYSRGVWPAGTVTASAPAAAAQVQRGDSVDLTVSSGCSHTTAVSLVPRQPGPLPVQVLVTVTDQGGGPRTAYQGSVLPGQPFTVSFCWTGNVAHWNEYENGSGIPAQQGLLRSS